MKVFTSRLRLGAGLRLGLTLTFKGDHILVEAMKTGSAGGQEKVSTFEEC